MDTFGKIDRWMALKPLGAVRWLQCAVVAWVSLVSGCGSGINEAVRGVDAQVPIALYGRHVVLDVLVNGEPAHFLLDSGASHNVVTEKLVQRLRLQQSEATVKGSGASANFDAHWVDLDDLHVGAASRRNQFAFVVPVPQDFTYDGILGTAFLEAFVITLDYASKTVRLQSRDRFTPPRNAQAIPMARYGNLITLQAEVAGHVGTCQIDTGAGNAVTVMRPAVERLGLRGAFTPSVRTLTGRSVGGDVHGDMVRVPEVVIGPYHLKQVVTELSLAETGLFASPDFLCNLGGDVWRRFVVTLDYGQQQLHLLPNAALAEPFLYSRGGLVIGLDQSPSLRQYRVLDTQPGGPADRAGLVTGDEVVSINGMPQSQLDGPAISALLLQAVGTQVTIQARDAQGQPKSAIVILEDLL